MSLKIFVYIIYSLIGPDIFGNLIVTEFELVWLCVVHKNYVLSLGGALREVLPVSSFRIAQWHSRVIGYVTLTV